jgi:hypothetical protein
MLKWMIFDRELDAYAERVIVQPYSNVFAFTAELYDTAKEFSGPSMDKAISDYYPKDMAEKLIGKKHDERVNDEQNIVEGWESVGSIDPGFIMFASNIDWDSGIIEVEWIDDDNLANENLFPSQDYAGSEFEKADYEIRFEGLKFDASRIELLWPNATFDVSKEPSLKGGRNRQSIGRPTKWSWDGVMAYVVSQAQTPDGLPTGAGAQARIEEMISGWFLLESGDSPAPSQVRQRAALIMKTLERPETPKNI